MHFILRKRPLKLNRFYGSSENKSTGMKNSKIQTVDVVWFKTKLLLISV